MGSSAGASLNRTSVGLKHRELYRGRGHKAGPQSNQRGIETLTPAQSSKRRHEGLNRTSVGLKQRARAARIRRGPKPQSNQRGIETLLSLRDS